jgi:ABC-type nickel/cobalt efflux system permease component RcnA
MEHPTTFSFLLGTAVSLGFVHTLIGVDHSLPFIMIGKARAWPLRKVLGLTALCGLGHVLSSVVLGFFGIGLGMTLEKLQWIETSRGELAANLLIGFGLAYGSISLWRALRNHPHSHTHTHGNGISHTHVHSHHQDHLHAHSPSHGKLTAWSLFVIFIFGPCEALIPLLMAPAAEHHWSWVILISLAFGATTIGTMVLVVSAGYLGLGTARFKGMERFANSIAGFAIAGSGVAIQLLGI